MFIARLTGQHCHPSTSQTANMHRRNEAAVKQSPEQQPTDVKAGPSPPLSLQSVWPAKISPRVAETFCRDCRQQPSLIPACISPLEKGTHLLP